ncbi:glutamate receptor ionotropic, delta-1-like [Argiope bruennichi]|uniref:glutamate receptor ionotropic, delta-1-like n=1 Tax=Argiope bruennichi TaxID=94029 RepID=UPI002494357B|nr:glutamate receptor ionotropic, delta-1-like [Argiope bruennichi]
MSCPSMIRVATVLTNQLKVNISKAGDIRLSGIQGIFLDIILQALNLQFELVMVEDQEWGRLLPSGQWTGMIGMLQRGEADISINLISMTEQRTKVVEFSTVYATDDLTFALKKPGMAPASTALVHPFDTAVWIFTLAILLLMPLVFQSLSGTKCTYSETFLVLLGAMLKQPLFSTNNVLRYRILVCSWLIFALILSSSYSAVLLSLLSVPKEMPAVQDFEELSKAVAESGYKCFVSKGSSTLDFLVNNEKEHLRFIGETVLRNAWYRKDHPLMQSPQIDLRSATVHFRMLLQMVAGKEVWKKDFLSLDSLKMDNVAIPMKKHFCHKKKLNELITRINQAGLYMKIITDETFRLWLNSPEKTIVDNSEWKPLRYCDLTGAFVSLFIGLKLAFVSLISDHLATIEQSSIGIYDLYLLGFLVVNFI